jgi:hypothetical protein
LLNTFIDKMVLALCISIIDLSTRRNIEQTPTVSQVFQLWFFHQRKNVLSPGSQPKIVSKNGFKPIDI